MEYKDYKTGEPISREQYIKNGLERGELLLKEDCGCVVIQDRTADAYIVGCNIHEAAPELYKALAEAFYWLDTFMQINSGKDNLPVGLFARIKEALAKVEANL